MTVRLFEERDLPAVYAIEEACFAPPLRFSKRLLRALIQDQGCRTLVGLADGVPAGFAIVSLHGEEEPDAAYVWTIEVLERYRRQGIGGLLLARVEDCAGQAGLGAIVLHVSERNLDALKLYERSGYVRVGIEPGYYGSQEDGLTYRKVLN